MSRCIYVSTLMVVDVKLKKENKVNAIVVYIIFIGCPLYFIVTRLDVMFTTNLLSRFMPRPSQNYFETTKIVLICLHGTNDYRLLYKSSKEPRLIGYTNND